MGPVSDKEWNRLVWEYLQDETLPARKPIVVSLDEVIDTTPFTALADKVKADVAQSEQWGITEFFRARGQESRHKKVYLTEPRSPKSHYPIELGDPAYWRPGTLTRHLFTELKDRIRRLPLAKVGRSWLIYSRSAVPGLEHSDHSYPTFQAEFVWMRLTEAKAFYVRLGEEKELVRSVSTWFDSRQQHCALPSEGFAVSLRVDGEFEPRVRDYVRSRYQERVLAALKPASPWRKQFVRLVDRLPGHRLASALDTRAWARR